MSVRHTEACRISAELAANLMVELKAGMKLRYLTSGNDRPAVAER
jgi:hypothetical protein